MQLLRNVYLVGGKHFYATVRGVADCNVYAVKTSEGIVLVDCGYNQSSLEMIDRNLRYWGLDPLDIHSVLLTHSHFDHTGNARTLRERGAKIVAHRTVGEALATGDERTIPYAFFRGDFPTCEIDIALGERDVIQVGEFSFDAINVPGHTEGNMVYLTKSGDKRVMFTGDFVFHERAATTEESLAWAGGTEVDTDRFLDSLLRIQRIRVDALLPGHNGFLLEQGTTIVDNALMIALQAWGNGYSKRRSR